MTPTPTMEVQHGATQSLPAAGGVRGLDSNDPMKDGVLSRPTGRAPFLVIRK